MTEKHFETLSAFFDGEPVDPALLAESLAQAGAAALLAEFAAMRTHVLNDSSRPEPGFAERVTAALQPRLATSLFHRLAPVGLAASLALCAGLMGFQLGTRAGAPQGRAPLAAAPVVLPPAAPAPATTIPPPAASELAPPPAHTRAPRGLRLVGDAPPPAVLRLRFLRWREVTSAAHGGTH